MVDQAERSPAVLCAETLTLLLPAMLELPTYSAFCLSPPRPIELWPDFG